MILLYIYAAISLAAFLMTALISINGAHLFKQRYPNIHVPKSHWSDKIVTWTRVAFMSAIPVFNAIYLLYLVFKADELTEASVYTVYVKYMSDNVKEKTNV